MGYFQLRARMREVNGRGAGDWEVLGKFNSASDAADHVEAQAAIYMTGDVSHADLMTAKTLKVVADGLRARRLSGSEKVRRAGRPEGVIEWEFEQHVPRGVKHGRFRQLARELYGDPKDWVID